MKYPIRLKRVFFTEDCHHLATDKAGASSRDLIAGVDQHHKLVVLEQDEIQVHIFRETAPDSGVFEHLHSIPNTAVAQTEPFHKDQQPVTLEDEDDGYEPMPRPAQTAPAGKAPAVGPKSDIFDKLAATKAG